MKELRDWLLYFLDDQRFVILFNFSKIKFSFYSALSTFPLLANMPQNLHMTIKLVANCAFCDDESFQRATKLFEKLQEFNVEQRYVKQYGCTHTQTHTYLTSQHIYLH